MPSVDQSFSTPTPNTDINKRIKSLYPFVDVSDTPLPQSWESKGKLNNLGLNSNNRRVHYKGQGKTHKDAASIRADHAIPAACGLYYYEVRIVSKGRDGYMGIGLSQISVKLERLPGWDQNSYGYHGDDGCSFCASGNGQAYGPTFSSGDVIGCALNLVDNTCFYTKNGQHLGIAFRDLPTDLHPTVGLQTPGEILVANFGQDPFEYDIEDEIREVQAKMRSSILNRPSNCEKSVLNKLVGNYLKQFGFHQTAESFGRLIGEKTSSEEINCMKNRLEVQKLILAGKIEETENLLNNAYPDLLQQNCDLRFVLKCRQFVEMVAELSTSQASISGSASGSHRTSSSNSPSLSGGHRIRNSHQRIRQSPFGHLQDDSNRSSPHRVKSPRSVSASASHSPLVAERDTRRHGSPGIHNGSLTTGSNIIPAGTFTRNGEPMDCSDSDDAAAPLIPEFSMPFPQSNGVSSTSGLQHLPSSDFFSASAKQNGNSSGDGGGGNNLQGSSSPEREESSDEDLMTRKALLVTAAENGGFKPFEVSESNGNSGAFRNVASASAVIGDFFVGAGNESYARLLRLGRDLHQLNEEMQQKDVCNEKQRQMLKSAYALLCYPDPVRSPLSNQLSQTQREELALLVNSSIQANNGLSGQSSLEVILAHAKRLQSELATAKLGQCAFTDPRSFLFEKDIFAQNEEMPASGLKNGLNGIRSTETVDM